jgi:predicted enzyme related to lactoylglutathione lyase
MERIALETEVTVVITRDTAWPEGTPCWVDLGVGDIPLAIGFYSGIFGWEVIQGGEETGGYSIAHLDGRTVAGIGPKMGPPDTPTVWTMYLATDDADATAAKVKGAGGHLLMDPLDVMDAGRMAIAADITGAAFGIPRAHRRRAGERAGRARLERAPQPRLRGGQGVLRGGVRLRVR